MKVANLGRAVAAVGGAVAAAGVAVAAGGVSVGAAAVAVGLAALDLAGKSHPDVWSNPWVIGAIVIGGIGLLIAVAVVVIALFRFVIGLFHRQAAASPRHGDPEPFNTQMFGETVTSQSGLPDPNHSRNSEKILAELGELIGELVGVPADKVTPDKNFVNDLGIDSLSMVEIAIAAQDKFGVEIPDEQLMNLKTVQDVLDFVSKSS